MLAVMTPPLSLVERKQRQARQRIIEAARELFLERGFDGVSVGDIAERAEVGRTTFFRHFGDKQEVVFANEQELMAAHGYPGLADHIRQHEEFSRTVHELAEAGAAGGLESALKLRGVVLNWLINHILRADVDYATFIRGK